MLLAVSPESVKLCAETSASELADAGFVVSTGVEMPYQTLLVAASLVVQAIIADEEETFVAETPEITGAVVSGATEVENEN